MCGIAGIAGFNDSNLVKSMTQALIHRGPDDLGYFFDDNIGLGNRRLSIIDLSTGKQPIHNEDKSVWITFNGEIFNYQELKKDLESLGHKFYTNSDTETIVHAYEQYPDFLTKLSGQFAFALYDSNKKKLILARDKMGVKPLYYTFIDGKLLFASEIKSILRYKEFNREINYDALNDYLTFRYVPGRQNLLKNIYKVPPAHALVYHQEIIEVNRYWDIENSIDKGSEEHFINLLRQTLDSSVKRQMISDVPVGIYLSGGIDSSVNAAIASRLSSNPINTFSVGFDVNEPIKSEIDETRYAKLVAEKFNTNHNEIIIGKEMIKALPKAVYHLDNPIAFETALPLYYLSKLTNKKNIKVVLTGDGGDELFLGYHRYHDMALREKIRKMIPFKSVVSKNYDGKHNLEIMKKISYVMSEDNLSYLKGFTTFTIDDKSMLYTAKTKDTIKDISSISTISGYLINDKKGIHSIQYADLQHWLPDMLLSLSDNMAMANSVEARVPLLDEDLVKLSFSMPNNLLLNGMKREYTKPLFKKAVSDLLPKEILSRSKHGFNVPLKAWEDNGLFELASSLLESEDAKSIFSKQYLSYISNDIQQKRAIKMLKLYSISMFLLWKKLNIDNESLASVGRLL